MKYSLTFDEFYAKFFHKSAHWHERNKDGYRFSLEDIEGCQHYYNKHGVEP